MLRRILLGTEDGSGPITRIICVFVALVGLVVIGLHIANYGFIALGTPLAIGVVTEAWALFTGGLVVAYALEILVSGYERSSLRLLLNFDRQIRYDLFFYIVPFTAAFPVLTGIMTFGLHGIKWPAWLVGSGLIPAIPLFPLQVVLAVLVTSLLQYWQHRLLHAVPLFWETHKFHHSAEQMTVLSYVRETPFTVAFNAMLISLPAAVIGSYAVPKNPGISDLLALWIWVAYTGINSVNQFLVHSNLRANYGWVGRWLIVSPANHRVHHSIQPEHLGKNFSVTLVLWDRVFGTFHEGDLDCKIGYEGNIYNRSRLIVDEYFYPLVAFLSGLWKILRVRMATKANRGAFASAYPGVAVRMTEKDRQRP